MRCAEDKMGKLTCAGFKHSTYVSNIDTRLVMSSTARAATNDSKSPLSGSVRVIVRT
jgi:hypothetical protein